MTTISTSTTATLTREFDAAVKRYERDRSDMPQVNFPVLQRLLHQLDQQGIGYRRKSVPVRSLHPNQRNIQTGKLASIVQQMASGEFPDNRPLLVSAEDSMIADGHHRWAARLFVRPNEPIDIIEVDLPHKRLIDEADRAEENASASRYAKFREQDHPRDEEGQFSSKEEGKSPEPDFSNMSKSEIRETYLSGNRVPARVLSKHFDRQELRDLSSQRREQPPESQRRPESQKSLFEPESLPEPSLTRLPAGSVDLPGVRRSSKTGRLTGATQMHVDQLKADPDRFQYKISGIDPKTGTTKELKEVKQYNPLFGGQILVWEDPDDGQPYVVNGHHRYELASRSPESDEWQGEMSVYFVDAGSAQEAKALGALANIAEGRGTAVDAANFLRNWSPGDPDKAIEDMKQKGVSLKGRVAADGAVLAGVSDRIFDMTATGRMTEGRALAIGRELQSTEKQDELLGEIQKAEERQRKTLPDSAVSEMARELSITPEAVKEGGLFGDFFKRSLIAERGQLKSFLRRNLSSEARAFREASSERRAETLESTGKNILDIEGNVERAQEAAESLFDFDHRANASGDPIAASISQAAEKLNDNPRRQKSIQRELLENIRGILRNDDAGGSGTGAGSTRRTGEPGGAGSTGGGLRRDVAAAPFSRASASLVTEFDEMHDLAAQFDAAIQKYQRVRRTERYTRLMNDRMRRYAKWEESEHPRDESGKFTSGAGGQSGSEETPKWRTDSPRPDFSQIHKAFPPANPQGKDTKSKYVQDDGSYTPERSRLHEAIIGGIIGSAPAVSEPTVYMMGGGPASGKSRIIKSGTVTLPENAATIDSDDIKRQLPEYQEMQGKDDSAAAYSHEESSHLSKAAMAAGTGKRANVVMDGTGDSSYEKLKGKVENWRKHGHKIVAHYVTVDTDEAVKRSQARAERTGRRVPESVIRETHASVSAVFPQAVADGLFDDVSLWDTGTGGDPVLVATAKGKRLQVHDRQAYERFLAKASG